MSDIKFRLKYLAVWLVTFAVVFAALVLLSRLVLTLFGVYELGLVGSTLLGMVAGAVAGFTTSKYTRRNFP